MFNQDQLKNELKTLSNELKDCITDIKNEIFSKINEFEKRVDELEIQTSRAIELAEANNHKIESLTNEIASLEEINLALREKLEEACQPAENVALEKKVTELEEKIEERTNRQLRETIVIKGVPEEGDESWERTTAVLAEIITMGTENIKSVNEARTFIKRAHREKNK